MPEKRAADKTNRCIDCGYMGKNMDICPVCRSKEIVDTNYRAKKEEAHFLACQVIDVTPKSVNGRLVRQLLDLVMG